MSQPTSSASLADQVLETKYRCNSNEEEEERGLRAWNTTSVYGCLSGWKGTPKCWTLLLSVGESVP